MSTPLKIYIRDLQSVTVQNIHSLHFSAVPCNMVFRLGTRSTSYQSKKNWISVILGGAVTVFPSSIDSKHMTKYDLYCGQSFPWHRHWYFFDCRGLELVSHICSWQCCGIFTQLFKSCAFIFAYPVSQRSWLIRGQWAKSDEGYSLLLCKWLDSPAVASSVLHGDVTVHVHM